MTFDKILDNNTLWAVRYDGVADNALKTVFEQWSDPEWLVDFFLANMADLESYFKITDINQAIYDTIDDNQRRLTSTRFSVRWRIVARVRCCWVRKRPESKNARNMLHGFASMLSSWNQDAISLLVALSS